MTDVHVAMLAGHHTFVQDWARAAAATGAKVTLIDQSEQAGRSPKSELASGVTRRAVPRRSLRPSRYLGRLNDRLARVALERALDELAEEGIPVTHLHTHFYAGSSAAVRVAQSRRMPLVHTEHSSAIRAGTVSRPGIRILERICATARTVFVVGEELETALRAYGVERELLIASNPVDIAVFQTEPPGDGLYPPVDGRWRFVTVGWLLPGKDHATLLRAFHLVRETYPDCHLTLIGDGRLEAGLRGLALELGIADGVSFSGRLNRQQIAAVHGASHCYVHTSRSETFGVALVEAWAAGLPVVTFDCGGVARHAAELGGALVEVRSPEALADAMRAQIERASAGRRLETARRAAIRFDVAGLVEELRHAYG